MATIVLVPGAWLGGWCWKRVTPLLQAKGHEVYPATLTGLGDRIHLARPEVDLLTHTQDVEHLIQYEELKDVVLVGHAYGAAVVTGAADRIPERIAHLVYLDGAPIADGESMFDEMSVERRGTIEQVARASGDGWQWPMPPPHELGQTASVAGISNEDFIWIQKKAAPQPIATYSQPIRLMNPVREEIRRTLILCSDGGLSLEDFRAWLERAEPGTELFAGPRWDFRELPTGHWPMFSAPEALADTLLELA